jgi:radical SAM superfamily enzyme YgiQ (UPF0313 family)
MDVKGQVLLINPWIYDFAAYNLWVEPLGLLSIAAGLQDGGYGVTVIDCLAPFPGAPGPRFDGTGKFFKAVLDSPAPVSFVPRRFGRYGLPLDRFEVALASAPQPDLVLVASGMTYWYPGVVESIGLVRKRLGSVPVALGGIYATLCTDHARKHSGADEVIAGPGLVPALRFADQVTGCDSDPGRYADPRSWPPPARGMLPASAVRGFAGVLTAWGCPYRCTYCGSHLLQPAFVQREPAAVVHEIHDGVRHGVRDFAFYDDALLLDAENHLVPILHGVLALGEKLRFHTPNGLHARAITPELAALLRQVGFASVRLSLETVDLERQRFTGGKVTTEDFAQAVAHLQGAGFRAADLAAYILAGLPGQPLSEVEATIRLALDLGVQAKLAQFSPIPGTPDGDRALPAGADPLLHNNTVYPYLQGESYERQLQALKLMAKYGNEALSGP